MSKRRLIRLLSARLIGYCADGLHWLSEALEPSQTTPPTAPAGEVSYGRTHLYDYSTSPALCVFCQQPKRFSLVVEECWNRRFR